MPTLPLLDQHAADARTLHLVPARAWAAFLADQPERTRKAAAASSFKAQPGKLFLLSGADCGVDGAVLGLGERPSPMLLGAAAAHLPHGAWRLAEPTPSGLDPTALAIAWALGGYAFTEFKPRARPAPLLCPPEGADMAEARRVAGAVYLVRDLINRPANVLGPAALQAETEALGARYGAQTEAIVGEALLSGNFPLIHAVGRAGGEPPRLLRLRWGGAGPRVTLVGKGVCFDSGGLNLKSSSSMGLMKKDMGGAAHVLGLAQLVMDADLPVRLDVLIPAVENGVAAGAMRPGDILKSRKGLTVEIDNTDAEGRLILADALALAGEDPPDLLLDLATLTGAARVALGAELAPFYTDDEALAADLAAAAAKAHDPLWRMPLWDGYDSDLDSPVADLSNAPGGGQAGSIHAALFLRRFVSAGSWAHFDIYAWSPKERPAKPQGGEATGLRAIWRLLRDRYGA